MNSSSAVSNVLLTSPVQPKTNTLSQRNVSDDNSHAAFKRALDDVRSEQRPEQDVKPKEPCAKKVTSADKRLKAKPDDAVADNNTTTSVEKPASQSTEKSNTNTKSDESAVSDDDTKKDDDTEGAQSASVLLAVPTEPTAQASILAGTVAASTGTVQQTDSSVLEDTSPLLTTENVIDASPAVNTPSAPATNTVNTVATNTESPLVVDTAEESQQEAVNPLAAPIDATKTGATGIDANNITAVVDDAEVVSNVIASAGADILKNSAAKVGDTPVTSPVSDDNSATSADPKAVFEKMLQAMSNSTGTNTNADGNSQGSPDSQGRATDTITSANAASSTTPSVLDSLVRGADAQSPAARSFVVQTAVPVPVGQPQWSQAVGEKVLWLAAQNVHSAEIRLDPPELGPMQVKISVNQEQTSINFTSHHAGVREVLDQNLGRLRDMFNEQGLNLVNVDVSDRSFQRHQGEGSEQQGQGSHGEQEDDESPVAVSAIVQQRLVDHYA